MKTPGAFEHSENFSVDAHLEKRSKFEVHHAFKVKVDQILLNILILLYIGVPFLRMQEIGNVVILKSQKILFVVVNETEVHVKPYDIVVLDLFHLNYHL